jgi:hypothetical protein
MNKHIPELKGEDNSSPELGFTFGQIPVQEMADFLASTEVREQQDVQDLKLEIDVLINYFQNGPRLMLWESYLEAQKQADTAARDEWLRDEVSDQYLQIAQMILTDHYKYIDEEKRAINSFLNTCEGLITKGVSTSSVALVGVDTLHKQLTDVEARATLSPVERIAFWSDGTQESIDSEIPLYVDMTTLPVSYSQGLNRYRMLYT